VRRRAAPAASLLLTCLVAGAAAADPADYWPSFRGPLSTGVAPRAAPPLTWSEGENLRFKVPIPGRGLASPVVWEDRVYLLTAVEGEDRSQRFMVLALSREDGSVLWERVATEAVPAEGHHRDNSWASASPVTDGRRLIAHFGSQGTFAYDLEGQPLWQIDLGEMTTRNEFGEASSPALWDDWVIVNWDHEGDSFVVALDADTGELRWKVERPGEVSSWSTPLIVEGEGGPQVVIASTGRSRGYELATGRELWSIGGMTVNVIPTPVEAEGVIYLTSGFRGHVLQALDLARAKGDLEGSEALLWTYDRDTPYVPTPLLAGGRLYFLKVFGNILTVLDARSGEALVEATRLEALHNVYASPVAAAGRVYFFDRDGHAVVLAEGEPLRVLAENTLDDGVEATPALVGGEIFVRSHEYLYCIAEGAGVEARSGRGELSPATVAADQGAQQ